jgi:hypothetical protein
VPNVKQKNGQILPAVPLLPRILAGTLVGLLLGPNSPAAGQAWRAAPPAEAHFDQQLQRPVQVRGTAAPLRPTLQRIAQAQGIAVFLDRRLDPQRLVELRGPAVPLGELLQTIARTQGARVSFLGPVAYIGPDPTTGKLATLLEVNREHVRQMSAVERQKWLIPTPTAWPFLTQPRQLVNAWSQQRGVLLGGTEQIPHDLWAAQQLPPLDLLHQLTIVLAGFDLCVIFEPGGQARVAPIPDRVVITRAYPWSARQASRAAEASSPLAEVQAERRDGQLIVTGTVEDHRRVSQWLQGAASRRSVPDAPTQQRYTLTVQNQPRGRLLAALAEQLKLELKWEDGDESVRSQVVSFQVQNVSLGELLDAALGDSGLNYRMDNRTLAIFRGSPRDPTPHSDLP